MGSMRITVAATTIQIVLRVALTFALAGRMGLRGIALAQLGGWALMMVSEVPYLLHALREVRAME